MKASARRSKEVRKYYSSVAVAPEVKRKSTQPMRVSARKGITPLKVDFPLLLITILLVIFGMLILFSASHDYSYKFYGDPFKIFTRQLLWLAMGVIVTFILVVVDYHRWIPYIKWMMLFTIFALIGVLFIGDLRNGTMRTILGGSVQPSEAAKLMIVLYLAAWLNSKRDLLNTFWSGLLPLAVIIGFVSGLILIQPDFSAGLTIFILGFMMFFLANRDYRQIAIMLAIAVVVGGIIIGLTDKGKKRMGDYISGLQNPERASYHVQRAYGAFINGGWFGVGLDKSNSKYEYLPVPPTDSIFAVVAEETGAVGALLVVVMFTGLLWRGLTIAKNAPDEFAALVAAGLSGWLALEAFINMAVVVNLLPFAGNALPFFSAGGSNLLVSLAAIGILLNISRLSKKSDKEEGRLLNAVTRMRGWDRRRRVSSAGRPTSRTK